VLQRQPLLRARQVCPVFFFQEGVQPWMTLHNRMVVTRPLFVPFM
jgi:hypothetical protein